MRLIDDSWISVDDKLPENNDYVLVLVQWSDIFGEYFIARYDHDDDFFRNQEEMPLYRVQYWMPLPKPPKGGKNE